MVYVKWLYFGGLYHDNITKGELHLGFTSMQTISRSPIGRPGGGGGGNAIYVPYGDVPPIRVYFLAFESETGCVFFRA